MTMLITITAGSFESSARSSPPRIVVRWRDDRQHRLRMCTPRSAGHQRDLPRDGPPGEEGERVAGLVEPPERGARWTELRRGRPGRGGRPRSAVAASGSVRAQSPQSTPTTAWLPISTTLAGSFGISAGGEAEDGEASVGLQGAQGRLGGGPADGVDDQVRATPGEAPDSASGRCTRRRARRPRRARPAASPRSTRPRRRGRPGCGRRRPPRARCRRPRPGRRRGRPTRRGRGGSPRTAACCSSPGPSPRSRGRRRRGRGRRDPAGSATCAGAPSKSMTSAATRSPTAGVPTSAPPSAPTPATRPHRVVPGVNGGSGRSWQPPRTIRASTKLTPAASTSTSTSPGPGSGWLRRRSRGPRRVRRHGRPLPSWRGCCSAPPAEEHRGPTYMPTSATTRPMTAFTVSGSPRIGTAASATVAGTRLSRALTCTVERHCSSRNISANAPAEFNDAEPEHRAPADGVGGSQPRRGTASRPPSRPATPPSARPRWSPRASRR